MIKNIFLIAKSFYIENLFVRKTIINKIRSKLYHDNDYITDNNLKFESIVNIPKNFYYDLDKKIYDHYMNNEYNILGKGWIKWEDDNKKIRWSYDCSAGININVNSFSEYTINYSGLGTDIKIPWELSRMYHWVQLAQYALCNKDEKEKIIAKFVYDVTDFMDKNKIGSGVNNCISMEISIRIINLLISFDILSQIDEGEILNNEFKNKFIKYCAASCEYICCNIEYGYISGIVGNHYFSDIVGIIIISSFINCKKFKKYKRIAVKEFDEIIDKQFLDDGGNFECSTAYHRLTAELSGIALLFLLKDIKFQFKKREKLIKIYEFLKFCIIKENEIIQIGDNDSGRVIIPFPMYENDIDNTLNVSFTVQLLEYLFDPTKNSNLFLKLFKINPILEIPKTLVLNRNRNMNTQLINVPKQEKYEFNTLTKILLMDSYMNDNWSIVEKPDFGLIKVTNNDITMFIRSIPKFNDCEISHAHEDIFHFEFVYKNIAYSNDLGSFCYTSNEYIRNQFISSYFHNVPIHKEKYFKHIDTFKNTINILGTTFIEKNTVIIQAEFENVIHIRKFIFFNEEIHIIDMSNKNFLCNNIHDSLYSKGYGNIELLSINKIKEKENNIKITYE